MFVLNAYKHDNFMHTSDELCGKAFGIILLLLGIFVMVT